MKMKNDKISNDEIRKLIQKYRSGRLTHTELIRLRQCLMEISNEEVSDYFENEKNTETSDVLLNDIDILGKTSSLISRIRRENNHTKSAFAFYKVAAVLVGLLLAGAVFLYYSNNHFNSYKTYISQDTEVVTREAEQVTISLPDGSKIKLHPNSNLKYSLINFNKKGRKISFNGYGEFSICKNPESPFTLNSEKLEIQVLGTEFDLLAREDGNEAMIYLKSGSIEAKSEISGESVSVEPKQLVILDYATGHFKTQYIDNYKMVQGTFRGDMVFSDTPFCEIIKVIESNHNIMISYDEELFKNKAFTGYLPSDNLDEVFLIIENAYNVTIESTSKKGEFTLR